jgi:hypothetical protein
MARLGETPAERVARLTFLDQQHKQSAQVLAEERYYKQFTHKPELSKKTMKLAATPLDDMWRNPKVGGDTSNMPAIGHRH